MNSVTIMIAAESWRDLTKISTRAILALISVTVGVAAVIAMLQIGHSARSEAERQFRTLGTDLIVISPKAVNGEEVSIPPTLAGSLRRDYPQISAAAAIIQRSASLRIGRTDLQSTIIAAGEEFYEVVNAPLASGRRSFDLDGRSPYAVLGAELARQIGDLRGRPIAIGDQIEVDDQTLTVIGLLRDVEPAMILALDLGRSLVVPLGVASRFSADPQIGSLLIKLAKTAADSETSTALAEQFQTLFRRDAVEIRAAWQLLGELNRQMQIYSQLLLAIGAGALLLGGFGVMNVMLMNVLERRQEIGLRLALGARRGDIQAMFLIEAALLSGVGAILGAGLGAGMGWLVSTRSNWGFDPAPMTIPLAIGMALAIGLFSGLYPAMRAARLDPIQALRG